MCNCGKKRVQYSHPALHGDVTRRSDSKMATPTQAFSYSVFEYTGKTAVTVRGNVTGTNYRFNFTGNRQNIDSRDAAGIMSVPVLKKVPK